MRSSAFLAITLIAAHVGRADDGAVTGEQLAQKSGCISCHRADEKLVGPGYKQIAGKYPHDEKTIDHLIQSVRNGSEGVWGDLPMPPSDEGKVSDGDLRRIIEWVLRR